MDSSGELPSEGKRVFATRLDTRAIWLAGGGFVLGLGGISAIATSLVTAAHWPAFVAAAAATASLVLLLLCGIHLYHIVCGRGRRVEVDYDARVVRIMSLVSGQQRAHRFDEIVHAHTQLLHRNSTRMVLVVMTTTRTHVLRDTLSDFDELSKILVAIGKRADRVVRARTHMRHALLLGAALLVVVAIAAWLVWKQVATMPTI